MRKNYVGIHLFFEIFIVFDFALKIMISFTHLSAEKEPMTIYEQNTRRFFHGIKKEGI